MKKLLREPLIHFLVIGIGLFLLFKQVKGWIGNPPDQILVSTSQIEQLVIQFSRTWLRPPTDTEIAGLIDNHVRDEVYYRTALSMGLDKNDPVIRRRMRQKLEMLLDDMTNVSVPSDQVLKTFMDEHADRFRFDPIISFHQVYLNPDKHQDIQHDAGNMLARLRAGAKPEDVGDPILLGYEFKRVAQRDIAKQFGDKFTQQVFKLEPGSWTGPLFSGYGAHLVMVTAKEEGRLPALSEIRADVEREWLALKRKELKDVGYRKLLENYEVVIEGSGDEE